MGCRENFYTTSKQARIKVCFLAPRYIELIMNVLLILD